jgi:protein subunit release factor A
MWQDRGQMLVRAARRNGAIFAMGDPGGILDAGRWSESDNNLGRLLKPHLESGELTVICECTADEFAAAHRKEPSFMDAFHRVDLPEPSVAETKSILERAATRLEQSQGVSIQPPAIAAAIELTRRFQPYRGFPGKAVRLLEESVRLDSGSARELVGRAEVVETFTKSTGLPLALLSDDVEMRSDDVADFLAVRVLGQPEAVAAVTDLVMVLKAALHDPKKPLGTFLFVGPTGVGKTELAKALAEFLFGSRDRVVRLDMGEYSTADAVQRLAGTTWQRTSDSQLLRRIREQPFCVVLLDEIEKAHWSVYDALLPAIGEGRLTDAAGRTADFRNAIVIMTSNLGAKRQDSVNLGFQPGHDHGAEAGRRRKHYAGQAEQFFRPEFFNRLDRIVTFHPLEPETVRRIARREVGHLLLREGIARRQLLVEIDAAVIDLLARGGFNSAYGARPLQREIEATVIRPLARLLVERSTRPGDLIHIRAHAGQVAMDLQRVKVPDSPRPEARPSTSRPDGTLTRAATALADLAKLVDAEHAAPVVSSLRAELSDLVRQTSDPAFWDQTERARTTMSRIYELQRAMDALDRLRIRVQGLLELSRRMREARDSTRLQELRSAIAEVDAQLGQSRLELASCSSTHGTSTAIVSVAPLGMSGEEWANKLAGMYSGWAARTGRDSTTEMNGASCIVRISGPAAYELLVTETGLHRRVLTTGRTLMARVIVSRPREDGDHDVREGGNHRATIVRIYDDSRRRVRDPRTDVQVKDIESVLRDGRIDEFILAWVRSVPAEQV